MRQIRRNTYNAARAAASRNGGRQAIRTKARLCVEWAHHFFIFNSLTSPFLFVDASSYTRRDVWVGRRTKDRLCCRLLGDTVHTIVGTSCQPDGSCTHVLWLEFFSLAKNWCEPGRHGGSITFLFRHGRQLCSLFHPSMQPDETVI